MLIVSTILRNAELSERSARIYFVDPELGQVRGAMPIPEARLRAHDRNPRGGMRGARGVAVGGGEVFVANFDTIFRFDALWQIIAAFSRPECADIHDLTFRDGRLWVASTRNDLVIEMDEHGRITGRVDVREFVGVVEAFGLGESLRCSAVDYRDPRTHDESSTDRLHINSFAFDTGGALLVSLGQVQVNGRSESALVRLRHGANAEVFYRDPGATLPAHNVVILKDGRVLHANTQAGQIIAIDLPAVGLQMGESSVETILATPGGYTRGLCLLDNSCFAVGVQNEVWIFDLEMRCVRQRITLTTDVRESVHSIALCPW